MLEILNLVAAYGEITALHGLSLSLADDAFVAVLGANGAGKSTLLSCLAGLLRPRQGKIIFQGVNLVGLEPEKIVSQGISLVPEGRLIFPSLTVRENLLMGGYLGKAQQISEGLARAMEYFPILKERLKQRANTLSGGEQQMLAIARALILPRKLLLLDEPSMGVAPVIKQQIFEQLAAIRRREKMAMILVEQDVDVALGVTDYAFVLETGVVVMEGRSEELKDNDELRRAYLGG
ncbi:MAG: ABC transporter ATP-binding protein [Thermodesulfobacteriota bacterium]